MRLDAFEKLETSFVALRQPDAPVQIRIEKLAALVKEPVIEQSVGAPTSIVRVTSMREQVEVIIEPSRVVLIDQSETEPARDRFPEIIGGTLTFLESEGLVTRAYGWNFKVAFSNPLDEPASKTILDRFIQTSMVKEAAGVDLESASVKVSYQGGPARCTLDLQPRYGDAASHSFWAHLNLHLDNPPEANIPAIRAELLERYGSFKEVLARLLGLE
jgi:hypothetical protein